MATPRATVYSASSGDGVFGGIERPPGWGAGTDVGSIVGNVWTPGRDGTGKVTAASVATLVPLRWYEVANTRPDLTLQPKVEALVPGWSDVATWVGCWNAYSGFAWDLRTGKWRLYFGPSGGHSASTNNGLYDFPVLYMEWGVVIPPTPRETWPPGYPGDTTYVGSGSWTSGPTGVWYDEVPEDGRKPTPRHTYGGAAFLPWVGADGAYAMLCRRAWVADITTKTWAPPRAYLNNNDPSTFSSAENMATWVDEAAQRMYHCGTNLSASTEDRNFWWNGAATFGTDGYYTNGGYPQAWSQYEQRGTVLHHLQYQHQNAEAAPSAVNLPTKPIWIKRHNLETSTATRLDITFGSSLSGVSWPSEASVDYADTGGITFIEPLNKYLIAIRRVTGGGPGDEWAWVNATTGVCDLATDIGGLAAQPYRLEGKVRHLEDLGIVLWVRSGNENVCVMRPE